MNNPMTTHGAVSWSELHSGETRGAHDFYSSLFGWNAKTHEMPNGGKYIELKVGEQGFGGVVTAGNGASRWLNYITVNDVEAACETARKKGGKVLVEAFDAPPGRIARLADPAGAEFFVIKYRPAG